MTVAMHDRRFDGYKCRSSYSIITQLFVFSCDCINCIALIAKIREMANSKQSRQNIRDPIAKFDVP